MSKKKLLLFSVVCLLIILSGCGSKKKNTKQDDDKMVYGVSLDAELSTGDPALSQDSVSNEMINQVMEGLYRLDEKGEPIPAMAKEEAEISDDRLTYTFKLRNNINWSNGDKVTAHDFVYAWQRVANPTTLSNYANLMYLIENGEEVNLKGADVKTLGVKALDDTTLQVKLVKQTPFFISMLVNTTFFPVNQKFIEEQGENFATNSETMVYNGPFILKNWSGTSSEWSYEKNKDYWDADNVKLDLVKSYVIKEVNTGFNLYQDNELDKINVTGEFAKQNSNNPDFVSNLAARSAYIEINHAKNQYLANKNIRLALALSIDNEQLAEHIIQDGSIGAKGLVTHKLMKNPKTGKDFRDDAGDYQVVDKEKAREYWDKGLEETNTDKIQLEFVIDDDDTTKKTSEAIQAQMEDNLPGLKLTLRRVPKKLRIELGDSGNFDILFSGWGVDKSDATEFLDLFTTNSSFNAGIFSSKEYDTLVDNVNNAWNDDEQKRYEGLIEAEKVLMEEVGIIPLYQKSYACLIHPHVKGFIAYPVGSPNYKYISIEKEE